MHLLYKAGISPLKCNLRVLPISPGLVLLVLGAENPKKQDGASANASCGSLTSLQLCPLWVPGIVHSISDF